MRTPAVDGTLLAVGSAVLHTVHGDFTAHRFHDLAAQHPMVVVSVGDLRSAAPLLARVHSSCITSEAYGGCDCDCAEQLDATLAHLRRVGRGALFYLTQEGRGAGFVAKARDRMLVQASGQRLTTFDAYAELGLPEDQRRYGEVPAACRLLGIAAPLVLLTNNPTKVGALAQAGVTVAGTEPFALSASPYNQHYLAAKADAGHRVDAPAADADAATLPEAVVSFAPHPLAAAPRFLRLASYLLPVRLDSTVWFRVHVYFDTLRAVERVVLTYGPPGTTVAPLVRVEPETLEQRFPLRRRPYWRRAAEAIVAHGAGRVLFVPAADAADPAALDLLATHVAPGARLLVDGETPGPIDAALAAALAARAVQTGAPRVLEPGGCAPDRGHDLLAARYVALPAALARTVAGETPPLGWDLAPLRRIVATGVGSSEAHARFLVRLLDGLGLPARFLPLSALTTPPPGADRDVLVVVSQGLSPNARLVLETAPAWRHAALVTAATETGTRDPDKRRALASLAATIVNFEGEDEYGTLLRVTGPLTGYVAAWRLARAVAACPGAGGTVPPLDVARVTAVVASAAARVDDLVDGGDVRALLAHPHFVTTGDYGELVANLRYKILEGLLLPAPPVWDLLHLAHGPFQQAFAAPATFLALARADAPDEPALLGRLASMLDPARHRLVPLVATLPGPFAILEHEALVTALVVRGIREQGIDQRRWPGHGYDAPLYSVDHRPDAGAFVTRTWRDVEARPPRTAIVPLGATEQHGPHLPLATDTWIADALAERLCARVGDAVRLPALPIGCSVEHAAFPGTVDLRPETLAAVLGDVLASLARQGITRAFLFSAHGGNVGPLAAALPALRGTAPLHVDAFTDLDAVTAALHRCAAAAGIAPEAAGHHAGEIETSILLALRPHAVRTDRLASGHVAPTADPQALFYPSLRVHAPDGTVGDPRPADATRGLRYLEAWVDVLVAAYRAAKNAPTATGSQNA